MRDSANGRQAKTRVEAVRTAADVSSSSGGRALGRCAGANSAASK